MCVNFNCIFFRKSMQLDLNKNNKKTFPRQNFVQIKGTIQNVLNVRLKCVLFYILNALNALIKCSNPLVASFKQKTIISKRRRYQNRTHGRIASLKSRLN